jgi:hypothetical protein
MNSVKVKKNIYKLKIINNITFMDMQLYSLNNNWWWNLRV